MLVVGYAWILTGLGWSNNCGLVAASGAGEGSDHATRTLSTLRSSKEARRTSENANQWGQSHGPAGSGKGEEQLLF